MKLNRCSISEILQLQVGIGEELRERGVIRSANNLTGDLAEYLFCAAFDWQQEPNSKRGFDATGQNGLRYEIKGRRVHRRNKSRQLSAIRDLPGKQFDVLACILFDDMYNIARAALIPHSIVSRRSSYINHTNSYRFILQDEVWDLDGVEDVTKVLRSVRL